jgi:hypothetical protein
VALTGKMSILRYDMSERSLVITNEDARSNAIKVRGGVSLYYRFAEELSRSFEQSRRLDMAAVPELPSDLLVADTVRSALSALDLVPQDGAELDDAMCALISQKAVSASHAHELGFQSGEARNPYPPG